MSRSLTHQASQGSEIWTGKVQPTIPANQPRGCTGPRGKKFVALVHIYAELRLPFDAALDAAEADLLREQNEGPERGRTAVANSPLFPLPPYSSVYRTPPPASLYRSSLMSRSR